MTEEMITKGEMHEQVQAEYDAYFDTYNTVYSFDDLKPDAMDNLRDDFDALNMLLSVIMRNIAWDSMLSPEEKLAKVEAEFSKYSERAKALISEAQTEVSTKEIGPVRKWLRDVASKVKSVLVGKQTVEDKETVPGMFTLWKEGNQYRWLTVYSNKFRDNDVPSDILSEQSHKEFVRMVDNKEVDYPELWHWHVPGTAWGKADYVAYDDSGFAIAAGYVYPGHETEAEMLSQKENIAVSHGMLRKEIVRDPEQNDVIIRYVTQEISDLPFEAAANKLTSFAVVKEEDTMAIPEKKKEYLKGLGIDVTNLEKGLEALGKEAAAAGIESKEANPEPAPADEQQTEPVDEEKTQAAQETAPVEDKEQTEEVPLTRKEVTEAFTEITNAIKALNDKIEGLAKPKEEPKNKEAEFIPNASIAAMISQNLSVIGKEQTKVDGREKLAKEAPEQTDTSQEEQIVANPVINGALNGIIRKQRREE